MKLNKLICDVNKCVVRRCFYLGGQLLGKGQHKRLWGNKKGQEINTTPNA